MPKSLSALPSLAWFLAILASCLLTPRVQAFQQENPRAQRIQETLEKVEEALVEIRRDLHRHPEVSGQEVRTAGVVAERLRVLGLEVETGIGGHGVVGVLEGRRPGAAVAYRADMDAVRSSAPDPVPFRSETPGVRHICGHDIHTTTALAVAEALAAIREDLPGTVKFIFQPAEENVQGAQAMIQDGVLENSPPAAIFAFHTAPMEVGQIGAVEGMGLSGLDRITITVSGAGAVQETARVYANVIRSLSTVGPPGSPPSEDGHFIYTNAGAMYWLGVSNTEAGTVGMPHNPGYVADEGAITVGARVMAAVLLDYLETHR